MAATTLDSFYATLEKSQLLSGEQLAALRDEFSANGESASAKEIAEQLVDRKLLTRWQAGMLLAGRHAFFLGRYKLLDRLGQGGMGSVFKAEQTPFGRIVALKVMAQKLVKDPTAVARFYREIQSAAALNHPHIVAAYDAASAQNTHFLVMEYVEGEDLGAMAKRRGRLPIGEACEYIRQAALGLQHAHEMSMVHRDIKPGNLLVSWRKASADEPDGHSGILSAASNEADSVPVVKILDMGLARLTSEAGEDGGLTQTGQIMGTPDYISPEQAKNTKLADIRSDIFSLGCTLFRLLAGELPFKGANAMESLMARALHDAPPLRKYRPDAPAELEAVVANMLAREPARRYQSPADVVAALAPFCGHQFSVGPASSAILEHGHRGTSAESGSNPSSLQAVGDAGVNQFLDRLSSQAAASERATIAPSADQTDQHVAPVSPAMSQSAAAGGDRALQARLERRRKASQKQMLIAGVAAVAFVAALVAFVLVQRAGRAVLIVDWPLDEREKATIELDDREVTLPPDAQLRFTGAAGPRKIRLSRDGFEAFRQTIELARGETKTVRPVWRLNADSARTQQLAALTEAVDALADENADGQATVELRRKLFDYIRENRMTDEALSAASVMSRLKWPWDSLSHKTIPSEQIANAGFPPDFQLPPEVVAIHGDARLKHRWTITSVAFSPDGKRVVSGGEDQLVKVWDTATGRLLQLTELNNRSVFGVAFSPDGTHVVCGTDEGVVWKWNPATGDATRFGGRHNHRIRALAYHPRGTMIATGSEDRTVKLWDPHTLVETQTLAGHAGPVYAVALNADGTLLASGGADRDVILWNTRTGEQVRTLKGHNDMIRCLAFSSDGQWLASGSNDDSFRLWKLGDDSGVREFKFGRGDCNCMAVTPDGKRLVTGWGNRDIVVFDIKTGDELRRFTGHVRWMPGMAITPDGQTLATVSEDCTVRLWDLDAGSERIIPEGHRSSTRSLAVSPDGATFATAGYDNLIKLWDTTTGKVVITLQGHTSRVRSVRFSSSGKRLVSCAEDSSVRLWDLETGKVIRQFTEHGNNMVQGVAIAPDGKRIASGCNDDSVRIWNADNGELLHTLKLHTNDVYSVDFSPDGQFLASSANDGCINLWNAATGKHRATLRQGGGVQSAAFSPDGKLIATAGNDGSSRVFRTDTEQQSRRFQEHTRTAYSASFSPDGRRIVTAGGDGKVCIWDPSTFNRLLARYQLGAAGDYIVEAHFLPDGRHIIADNNRGVFFVLRLPDSVLRPETVPTGQGAFGNATDN